MSIIHDGAGFSRSEKVKLISSFPKLIEGIKVCWEGSDQASNCGFCEKCVRTRLNFLSVGISNPSCFGEGFDVSIIDSIEIKNRGQLAGLQNVIKHVTKTNKTLPDWARMLSRKVKQLESHFENQDNSKSRESIPGIAANQNLEILSKEQIKYTEDNFVLKGSVMSSSNRSVESEVFPSRLRSYQRWIGSFLRHKQNLVLLSDMPGNLGDHLIWAGTERLIQLENLKYRKLSVSELPTLSNTAFSTSTLVVPGSGAMTSRWNEWLPDLIQQASGYFNWVVILPSEFETQVDKVHQALSCPNVLPFARDAHSFQLIKDYNAAGLSLDPALWAFDFCLENDDTREDNDLGKVLLALRTDSGSLLAQIGQEPATDNQDISLSAPSLGGFLEEISKAETVVSDRLHVVVAATMLGKTVRYVDPYNNKISRYAEFNFGGEFDRSLQKRDESWLLDNGFTRSVKTKS